VIIRNTAVGIDGIRPAVIEAARGMGMTDWQILLRVELPLALPVIFAGLRIAAVSTISLATLASFFGAKSLGNLIFEGIAAGGLRNDKVAAGALGAAALAIIFNEVLKGFERRFHKGTA
jgi:osmoprotectant transport system permease protein